MTKTVLKPKVLVTGSNGFVGKAVVKALLQASYPVQAIVRQMLPITNSAEHRGLSSLSLRAVGTINSQTNWKEVLKEVNTVVHCAARAHVLAGHEADALAAYRETNVAGTINLANQAAASGVKRFIFLSSIGVNGRQSVEPFTEIDSPNPQDAYAVSKLEAEEALLALAPVSNTEFVIIRPPLVYGPNAPGNFGRLVRCVELGLPLPFGAVHNLRSLVALDNLVSLILFCVDKSRSSRAANEVFVVADGEDISTTSLLRKVARAAGCSSRLLPVSASLLRGVARLLGKESMSDSLLGDLQVNDSKVRTLLGWRPVITMDEQLASMFKTEKIKAKKQA
jgi:nucleoside-diphosphate-sugar epimerase